MLQGIIRSHVDAASVIHSDDWRSYDGIGDLGYKKHYRIVQAKMNSPRAAVISLELNFSGHMRNGV